MYLCVRAESIKPQKGIERTRTRNSGGIRAQENNTISQSTCNATTGYVEEKLLGFAKECIPRSES